MNLSVVFRPVGSPRFKSRGCRTTWFPWLLPLRAIASVTFKTCSYRCRSCSSHPLPALFSSKTSPSGVLTVSSAPDLSGERLWVVLPARYPFSALSPSTLVASRSSGSGDCLPLFPFLFPWSLRHSKVNGWGAGMGLPIGLFLFSAMGLPCLRTSGNGHWRQSLAGSSVRRDG